MMDSIRRVGALGGASSTQHALQTGSAGAFGAMLEQVIAENTAERGLEFSKHAQKRAEERGIVVTPALMSQLRDSVSRAQDKGAKQIVAMDANRAFIINVQQNRVITAMSQEEMRNNIFTNIDGAVLLRE